MANLRFTPAIAHTPSGPSNVRSVAKGKSFHSGKKARKNYVHTAERIQTERELYRKKQRENEREKNNNQKTI